jgi:hypothetical protein
MAPDRLSVIQVQAVRTMSSIDEWAGAQSRA